MMNSEQWWICDRATVQCASLRRRLSQAVRSCTHGLPLSLQLLGVSRQLAHNLWVQVLSKFFSLSREFVQLTKSRSKSQTPGVPVTANHTAGAPVTTSGSTQPPPAGSEFVKQQQTNKQGICWNKWKALYCRLTCSRPLCFSLDGTS